MSVELCRQSKAYTDLGNDKDQEQEDCYDNLGRLGGAGGVGDECVEAGLDYPH